MLKSKEKSKKKARFSRYENISNYHRNVYLSFLENKDKFDKMELEFISIEESPFSDSCYLKFNHKILDEVSIRVSDHKQKDYNDYSYTHIYSIYSVNGSFNISLVYLKEIVMHIESKMTYDSHHEWISVFYGSHKNKYVSKQLNKFR